LYNGTKLGENNSLEFVFETNKICSIPTLCFTGKVVIKEENENENENENMMEIGLKRQRDTQDKATPQKKKQRSIPAKVMTQPI